MKLLTFLTLTALLSFSCSHKNGSAACCKKDKESCAKEESKKDCKDGSCDKTKTDQKDVKKDEKKKP